MPGWLEAFIAVATIAIVIQMAILLALFVQVRVALQHFTRVSTELHARIDPILLRTNRILEDSQDRITSITRDSAEIVHLARNQAQKVDIVFTDAVERLRLQVLRADEILTGTLEVIEEAGSAVRQKVWAPVHQASAVLKGIKAGLDFIRGHQRRNEAREVSQDEELFI